MRYKEVRAAPQAALPGGKGVFFWIRTTATLVFLPWRLVLNTKQSTTEQTVEHLFSNPRNSAEKRRGKIVDSPNYFHLGGTLGLFLLPLRVVPVQFVEEDHQSRHQVEMFVHPACFQDALWDVPLVGSPLQVQSTREIMSTARVQALAGFTTVKPLLSQDSAQYD